MAYLFFDYDGTLIKKDYLPMSEPILEALSNAKKAGHKLFMCTGRCRYMLPLPPVEFDGFILSCGTDISVGEQSLVDQRIDPEILPEFAKAAKKQNASLVIEGKEVAVTVFKDLHWPRSPFVETFEEYLEKYGKDPIVNKISIVGPTAPEFKELADKYGLDFIDHKNNAEFVTKGFSKATGIELILKHFGASKADSYGFGDSMNDYEMISYVGTGIVVANAVDELKQIADYVAPSVHEDGVAYYINNILLDGDK